MKCICGDENCLGFCSESIGSRLFKFLGDVTLYKSYTGDTDRMSSGDLITVTGGQIHDDFSTSKIYKRNIEIENEPKLSGVGGINTRRALQMFVSMQSLGDESLQVLDDIENRRMVIVPFKPKNAIKIKVHKYDTNGNSKLVEVASTISSVKWNVEKDDEGNVHDTQTIIAEYKDLKTKVHAKADINTFGDRFTVSTFEDKKPSEYKGKQVVKMSMHGFFYPICIKSKDDKFRVMIDNCNIYTCDEYLEVSVIGVWNESKMALDKELSKKDKSLNSFTSKHIKPLESYLNAYKDYIAPLGTCETNVVTI